MHSQCAERFFVYCIESKILTQPYAHEIHGMHIYTSTTARSAYTNEVFNQYQQSVQRSNQVNERKYDIWWLFSLKLTFNLVFIFQVFFPFFLLLLFSVYNHPSPSRKIDQLIIINVKLKLKWKLK